MTERPAANLTYGLRELVWGIESEVAVITSLSHRIDERVERLNAARGDATRRLVELDELLAATEDADLLKFLEAAVAAPLPQVPEHFPARIYGS